MDELCFHCGIGFYLPSGVCDHCHLTRAYTGNLEAWVRILMLKAIRGARDDNYGMVEAYARFYADKIESAGDNRLSRAIRNILQHEEREVKANEPKQGRADVLEEARREIKQLKFTIAAAYDQMRGFYGYGHMTCFNQWQDFEERALVEAIAKEVG